MIAYDDIIQGSDQWFNLRCGIPTASEWDAIVTPNFEPRKGDMPNTYLAKKLGEKWGGPLPSFSSAQMEQGSLRESLAIPWYEMEYDTTVKTVGFVTSDDGRIGCSPDGLIGDDCGIEAKCPTAPMQIAYVLDGKLPKAYAAQVHGSMLVTNRPKWVFLSYRYKFPPLVLTIERDEKIDAALRKALDAFLEQFDAGMAKLKASGVEPPNWRRAI